VAIVDETVVRLILGGRNAVRLMVREARSETSDTPGPWHAIVGVVEDVTLRAKKKPYDGMLYRPAVVGGALSVQLLVHTQGPAAPMVQKLQAAATPPIPMRGSPA
jgi:hypothetical protein